MKIASASVSAPDVFRLPTAAADKLAQNGLGRGLKAASGGGVAPGRH
jgi:hypothetical protein